VVFGAIECPPALLTLFCVQVEDVSDETIIQRHERCEIDEKKRFLAYVKNPHTGRARMHRRTDSRAGSSGANTPGNFWKVELAT